MNLILAGRRLLDLAHFEGDVPAPISFTAGLTFCLGGRYSELEVANMPETLARRMPDVHQAGSVVRLKTNFVRAVRNLRVKFMLPIAARA